MPHMSRSEQRRLNIQRNRVSERERTTKYRPTPTYIRPQPEIDEYINDLNTDWEEIKDDTAQQSD
jgi:hypothetical protein